MRTDAREWPACKKCQQGLLIPLSDYGRDGAPITYKAWVCSNPECGFNIRIDNGEISFGRAIEGDLPVIDADVETALGVRSEEHTSELQSRFDLVCRLLL